MGDSVNLFSQSIAEITQVRDFTMPVLNYILQPYRLASVAPFRCFLRELKIGQHYFGCLCVRSGFPARLRLPIRLIRRVPGSKQLEGDQGEAIQNRGCIVGKAFLNAFSPKPDKHSIRCGINPLQVQRQLVFLDKSENVIRSNAFTGWHNSLCGKKSYVGTRGAPCRGKSCHQFIDGMQSKFFYIQEQQLRKLLGSQKPRWSNCQALALEQNGGKLPCANILAYVPAI